MAWTDTRSGIIGAEGKRRLTNSAVAAWSIANMVYLHLRLFWWLAYANHGGQKKIMSTTLETERQGFSSSALQAPQQHQPESCGPVPPEFPASWRPQDRD